MIDRRTALHSLCCFGGLGLASCLAENRKPIVSSNFRPTDQASAEAGLFQKAEQAEAKAKRSPLRIVDPALETYLKEIACKVSGTVCENARVYVMRVPAFNASMFPNGMMQIWSGLLLRVQNEAQLAAIIGHEMGHFIEQHTFERHDQFVNTAGFALILSMGLAGVGIPAGAFVYLASSAHLYGFNRSQELEADLYGLTAMRRSGYDADEAVSIWRQLIAEHDAIEDKPERDIVFSTHPSGEERMKKLEAAAKTGVSGGNRATKRLQGLIAPYRKEWLTDEVNRGSYSSLLSLIDTIEERQGDAALTQYFRGEALRRRGRKADRSDAIQAYSVALAAPDTPVETYRGLGLALHRNGDIPEAEAALQTYVDKAPEAADRALIQSMIKGTS